MVECKHHQYIRKENFKLQNHVIETKTKTARNYLVCESLCNSAATCKSFNWNQSTKTCETNNATEEMHSGDFVSQADWVYHEMETLYAGKVGRLSFKTRRFTVAQTVQK